MKQLDLELDKYDCETASIYARMEQCHKGVGWVWLDRLLCKSLHNPEDETCHWDLFGYEILDRSRFRGWFHNGILVVMDRHGATRDIDEIPEQLYRHLLRKFKFSVGSVRFW